MTSSFLAKLFAYLADREHERVAISTVDGIPFAKADPHPVAPHAADHRAAMPTTLTVHPRAAVRVVGSSPKRADAARNPQAVPPPTCRPEAQQVAIHFLHWVAEHKLSKEWQVDEIWFLATEDFAVAMGVTLPPRRTFLGALHRVPGVRVTYDRRVRGRDGGVLRKTTYYHLQ